MQKTFSKQSSAPRQPVYRNDHLPRIPRMESRTPNIDPASHWKGVLAHLEEHSTGDRAGLAKARKMLSRLR